MTEQWEEQETKYARRTPAQRFKITYEQIDLLSWMAFDSNNEEYQYLAYENGTGKDLLEAVGDHPIISDLEQIILVFSEELAVREEKHSGITRHKAPCAPPKPPLMRVGCNGSPCPLCGSGMKPSWLFFKSKGCYQSECENYWRNK